MLTTSAQILKRLDESNDVGYYQSKWKEACSLLSTKETFGTMGDGQFKSYPDIQTKLKEIGTSSRILNACILQRAQVMRSIVEPEFPQVDKRTGEIRKQTWLERAKGSGYADGDWLTQLAAAFMDALPFGSGYVKFGPRTNFKTSAEFQTEMQYTDCVHVPILQMLFDRGEKTLARARYACDMTYLPLDIARDRFGKTKADEHVIDSRSPGTEAAYEVVRVFEYWDTGYGVYGKPTRAILLGDITEEPIEIDENVFGCLPYAHMDYMRLNNTIRPIGLVSLAAANQEDINQQERKRRNNSKRKGFDIVDQTMLDETDLERVNAGEDGVVVRFTGGNGLDKATPFVRVPGGELAQSDQWNWEQAMEEFRTITGTSELDNGSSVTGAETLGETQLVDQRSKKKAGLLHGETALFLQRCVEKFCKIAAVVDNDFLIVDFFGTNIPLNIPDEPASALALWLEEKSNVLIGEEALQKGDQLAERAQRAAVLAGYRMDPIIAQGAAMWLAEETLKNGGDDPKEVLQQMQGITPGQPMQPGMPGQPQGQSQQVA